MGDRYTITERIDQGGMAEVFLGVAESIAGFKKNVAIKRILPNLTKNEKFVSMFLDEAKLSLYLQHANIVQVFDIGVTDNAYFLVMEYVNGCNLKGLLERLKQRGKRIELAQAIYLMIECCKALNYAHNAESTEGEALRIVHRDISPPNILLSKMGEVKLVDFGLAKANSQIESTDPGVVKGKFSYLSPEAASGLEVDHRADIFAVGIILWEMFTGRRLFYGETDYQTVELVRQARIPSLQGLNPDVDAELEAIVRRALERDPDTRFQHAADLGDELTQYLFQHRMKVSARDIASLVRDAAAEQNRKRKAEPKGSFIDGLIMEEMARITSLRDEGSPMMAHDSGGGESLDPMLFLSGDSWGSDMGDRDEPAKSAVIRSRAGSLDTEVDEAPDLDSLQQMLEPDRTGVHKNPLAEGNKSVLIALVIAVLLAGAVGVGVFLFKDRIFGGDSANPKPPATRSAP